jgi:hypothetical protein
MGNYFYNLRGFWLLINTGLILFYIATILFSCTESSTNATNVKKDRQAFENEPYLNQIERELDAKRKMIKIDTFYHPSTVQNENGLPNEKTRKIDSTKIIFIITVNDSAISRKERWQFLMTSNYQVLFKQNVN